MNVEQLRELLNHLNDPGYAPEPAALAELGLAPGAAPAEVRAALVRLIERLRPPPDAPEDSLARRFYRLLTMRYLAEATQYQVADALGVSIRHMARLQNEALQALAEQIGRAPLTETESSASQLEREVNALYRETSASEEDLGEIAQSAARLALPLALERGVSLRVEAPPQACRVVAPKAVLSQAALSAITYAVRGMARGEVCVAVERDSQEIRVRIAASPHEGPCPREPWLVQELLEPLGGSVACRCAEGVLELTLTLQVAPPVRVLVIDDNRDMLRFYRRCVVGTPFEMVELSDGRLALERARSEQPEIIVLDLMLPNVDGWELLTELTNDPTTRQIPLVVCSVVDESELALSLGATASIVKPVSRESFRAALYRAQQRAAAAPR